MDNKILHDALKKDYASKDEVIELIKKYREENDETKKLEIRDVIFFNNIRHIRKISTKFSANADELEDCFNNGVLGFFDALEHFDVNKNVAFITYLYYWVHKYILEHKSDFLVKVPSSVKFMNYSFAKYKEIVDNDAVEENKDYLKNKIFKNKVFVKKYLNKNESTDHNIKIIRLDNPISGNDRSDKKNLFVLRDDKMSPEESVTRDLDNKKLIEIIKEKLSEKESQLVLLRYFSDTEELVTFREIVGIMGTTVQRLEQVEKRALEKLKKVFIKINREG